MKHIDPSILSAGIPVAAMRAEPMTTAEIDAHPDAARIWAAVQCLREAAEGDSNEGRDCDDAEDEGYSDAIGDIDGRIRNLLREADIPESLAEKIRALTDGL